MSNVLYKSIALLLTNAVHLQLHLNGYCWLCIYSYVVQVYRYVATMGSSLCSF